jgi:hypothetical protein
VCVEITGSRRKFWGKITKYTVGAGVPIFLANLAVSGWIKFIMYPPGAGLMTGIVGLGLAYLALTILQWLVHLVKASKTKHQVHTPPPL